VCCITSRLLLQKWRWYTLWLGIGHRPRRRFGRTVTWFGLIGVGLMQLCGRPGTIPATSSTWRARHIQPSPGGTPEPADNTLYLYNVGPSCQNQVRIIFKETMANSTIKSLQKHIVKLAPGHNSQEDTVSNPYTTRSPLLYIASSSEHRCSLCS